MRKFAEIVAELNHWYLSSGYVSGRSVDITLTVSGNDDMYFLEKQLKLEFDPLIQSMPVNNDYRDFKLLGSNISLRSKGR
jgi:hypothetical protein